MSLEKSEALVIRLADFSNTSRVGTFFTRNFGRISAIAKGGRRLRGPFDTGLDLLSTIEIVFIRKSGTALDILTEARLVQRFRPQASALSAFYAGCYVAELLAGLTADHDPHPGLYDAARAILHGLPDCGNVRLPVLWFELVLLRETGHLPSFDVCLLCGEPVEVSRSHSFWVSQGGLLCPRCQRDEFARHQVSAGAVTLWRTLEAVSFADVMTLEATGQQLKELRYTLTGSISGLLGRRPGTLKFIEF